MTASQAGLPLTLLVLGAMLYPLWILGRRARRLRRENGSWPLEEVAALVGLTAFYLHSMMEIHVQIPGIMAAYFAFSLAMLSREEPPAEAAGLPRPAAVGLWLLFLGLGIASILAGDWALKGEMAHDRLLSLASRSNKSPEEHARVSPDAVRMTMREATRLRPDSPFPYSVAADFMLSRDNLDEAEFLLEEAQKRAPKRPSIYQRRAVIALKRGDRVQAQAWMDKARALFPNNPDYQKPVSSGKINQ
jgi:tetratricopeptide (TPR) repeat protein